MKEALGMSQIQYFLGANSPTGFYSLYHELSDPQRIRRLYILKGGAGCGKSSLMKRIARHAEAKGLEVQSVLCSGDPDSWDAVILPELGTAVVDGTAPHVVEANCPGAVETYVDLSQFYDHRALQPIRSQLIDATAGYKACYTQAYRCLYAAGQLHRNLLEEVSSPELQHRLEKRAQGIIGREIKKTGEGPGLVEERFLSATTHRGPVCLWDTVSLQAGRVYELTDSFGIGHHLLQPIENAANTAGYHVIACKDPVCPERLAHLILPELSLAFVTSSGELSWPHHAYRHLRLDAMVSIDNKPRMKFTRKVADALTTDGIANLARAKALHDHLEELFNPHVDFEGVYGTADRLAKEILES